MVTIYQAGPLFSEAEQLWHLALKAEIEKKAMEAGKEVNVVWPYQLFDQAELQALGAEAHVRIFQGCLDALKGADLVIALLDGVQVDDGTAWEMGYAYHAGIPVYGIRTDFRQAGDCPGSIVNAVIQASCGMIFRTVDELLAGLGEFLATRR